MGTYKELWDALRGLDSVERHQLYFCLGYETMNKVYGSGWWFSFPDEFDGMGRARMDGIAPGAPVHKLKKQEAYLPGNIKVTEHKVAKEVVEPEPEPKKVEMGQRFHKGHRIQYSKDTFCHMKCLNCGIIGRTYLIPFEEPCERAQAHEYGCDC